MTTSISHLPISCSFPAFLQAVVSNKGNEVFGTWYDKNGNPSYQYTYKDIWDEAGSIAYILRHKWSLKKGDRIVVCYDFGLQFFAAFLACLRAGVTAVLVYPPSPRNMKISLPKLRKVTEDCEAKCILLDSNVKKMKTLFFYEGWPNIKYRIHPTNLGRNSTKTFTEDSLFDHDIAFLQYTSGSTGDPKVRK